ncbi:MAG: glycosyltransferase family 61 protein, partial [Gammaproteobacteria bacterium]|nr:glycosyltransferase family 61 protein [Gammaproteobacteria bacterium]
LSKIFYKVAYISATDAEQKTQLSWLKTEYSFNHHDFIDYSPNNDFIQLSDLIKEQAGINSNDLNYVLLSQRPVGNRYLIDSETGIPLEEYLRNALGKRSIPFKFCDFSVMAPAEQAKVCGGAKLFISAHGAGNSNIIFTPSHCHILEYNFRKYWHCHPVCDAHFHGELPDHQKCDGEFKEYPLFHKADYHNLCHLLGRPYTELEAIRYEGFNNRNPI